MVLLSLCKGYRLPTEAEWEYAARAGTTTVYYCGDNSSCLKDIAWYNINANNKIKPVAQKTPNAFGLYDISGNVWEWVWDYYSQDYGANATDPTGPTSGQRKVLRGCCWGNSTSTCRIANRDFEYTSTRNNGSGLRPARTIFISPDK